MARSANRLRSLERVCDQVHDRAFSPQKYPVAQSIPEQKAPTISAAPAKSHKEWLEDHFHQSVQKEFARLGIV
jgi:hypothetical protein